MKELEPLVEAVIAVLVENRENLMGRLAKTVAKPKAPDTMTEFQSLIKGIRYAEIVNKVVEQSMDLPEIRQHIDELVARIREQQEEETKESPPDEP